MSLSTDLSTLIADAWASQGSAVGLRDDISSDDPALRGLTDAVAAGIAALQWRSETLGQGVAGTAFQLAETPIPGSTLVFVSGLLDSGAVIVGRALTLSASKTALAPLVVRYQALSLIRVP